MDLDDRNVRLAVYEFMLKEYEEELVRKNKDEIKYEHFSAGFCYYIFIRFGIEYIGILPELNKAIKQSLKNSKRVDFIAEMGELLPRISMLKSVIKTTKISLIS